MSRIFLNSGTLIVIFSRNFSSVVCIFFINVSSNFWEPRLEDLRCWFAGWNGIFQKLASTVSHHKGIVLGDADPHVKRKLFLASLDDSPESPPQDPALVEVVEDAPLELTQLSSNQTEAILPRIASCPAQLEKTRY